MRPYEDAPRLPEGSELDPKTLLGNAERIELEIGPGRGWFMIERLEVMPQLGMLGFEIRRKWASIVDERLRKRGHGTRARVFAEDALPALARLASGSISVAYVHFPDPWWKKKHKKRLVLSKPLLDELARTLKEGGELFIQTDVFERAAEYEALVEQHSAFQPYQPAGPRIEDHPYEARSPRERRAIEDGLPVVRLRYRRV